MTFVRSRGAARRAVAALASVLLAAVPMAAATPASAAGEEEVPYSGGATATLDGLRLYGQAVVREDGKTRRTGAGLFQMGVDGGGTFQTYSVDLDNPVQQQARYEEAPAVATPLHANRYAGKIRWILRNSYPQVNDLQKLAKEAGARQLTPRAAAAGTQVAIWRFAERARHQSGAAAPRMETHSTPSGAGGGAGATAGAGAGSHEDGAGGKGAAQGAQATQRPSKHVTVEAADPSAEKLADHLEKVARQVPEPGATLRLDRTGVSGRAGGKLGPVTVHTREPSVTVAPGPDASAHGVRIVDAKGKPVKTAHNGSKLYFAVPEGVEPGSTSVTVQAATKLPVGRTLSGAAGDVRSPTQIVAGSSWSTVIARAEAYWADHGAIPAATAQKNCEQGVVETTVHNGGDRPFSFGLAGGKHYVAAGATTTVQVPVREDQPYRIAVSGPHGYERTFSGVLDCATASSTASAAGHEATGGGTGAVPQMTRPATVGGAGKPADSVDLAETGGSSSTPVIIGIAIAFVVVGGVAILVVRRRDTGPETGTASAPAPAQAPEDRE
ncbi:LAETG motif-containing sortase-dependent surface protein [Streptomyces sp. ODS28]|uniref:LAETG motif-containing sortase-dependent surface protein n=1 Tax=Streptomyces sp. ODS28 TaxID=3136688 RepID=UPI0031EA494E